MLALLGNASERKLRLFACACCRRVWRFQDAHSRPIVEAAERHADGAVGVAEWSAAGRAVWKHLRGKGDRSAQGISDAAFAATGAALDAARPFASASVVDQMVFNAETARAVAVWAAKAAAADTEAAEQCRLLRCLFGSPFRPVQPSPAWRAPLVAELAAAAYEVRQMPDGLLDPGRLAVLADALEEAGCADAALLEHLRDGGQHCRGCWALDGLLGRQ
jgi:hypothetical protein